MDISELIYDQGLDVGYSRIGALELHDIHHEAMKKMKADHPWAKSMIIAAFHYNFYKIPDHLKGKVSKRDLFKGRYLEGSHEHDTAKAFEAFLAKEEIKFLDLPALESSAKHQCAAEMGIGRTRNNGYFYTEDGSYCHLHAWLVDAHLTCDFDEPPTECPDHCSICVRTCPQKALTRISKDPLACIAYKTDIAVDNYTIGCDQCQDFCPFNKHRWAYEEEFIGLTYD